MRKTQILAFLIGLTCNINAQIREQAIMDSLLQIVNNPEIKDADRIDPLARLSRVYIEQNDSILSEQSINRARALAIREKDSKYMIYVHIQELFNCTQTVPKKIIRACQLIDSIYISIEKTSDREAQALGFLYIGTAKFIINYSNDNNADDLYKALSIAEKLPEKSEKKYRVLCDVYNYLYYIFFTDDKIRAVNYLDLMQKAAEKTGDADYLCSALYNKLDFTFVYSPNDTVLIGQSCAALEEFLLKNRDNIRIQSYLNALNRLITKHSLFPNDNSRPALEELIEDAGKITAKTTLIHHEILTFEFLVMYLKNNFVESIKYLRELIEFDKTNYPQNLFVDWSNLAEIYEKTGQYKEAAEARKESLEHQKLFQRYKLQEQLQLYEVKFGVEKQKHQIEQQHFNFICFSITSILAVGLLLTWALLMNRKKKIVELEKEKAKLLAQQTLAEKEIIGKKLITNVAELNRKHRLLEKAKDMNKEQISKAVRYEQKTASLTTDYGKLFYEIRPEFYERLQQRAFPEKLSNTDLKYCGYISLRMHNKDLASVMNVEYNTVVSQKYRLKKKLHLNRNDDLDGFVAGFLT